MKRERKKVIVSLYLHTPAAMRHLAGIFRRVSNGLKWDLVWQELREDLERYMVKDPVDGIIMAAAVNSDIAAKIDAMRTPVVSIDISEKDLPKIKRLSKVYSDDLGVGTAVAEHVIGFGNFRSYGFVPAWATGFQSRWSSLREQGFSDRLRKENRTVEVFPIPEDPDKIEFTLRKWLIHLDKPTAIMTASDKIAIEVMRIAKEERLKIPHDIALVGTDDVELVCDNARPRLTSIRPGHEACGYAAAEELERLMRGCRPRTRLIPYEKITDRDSLAPCVPATHIITAADVFIAEHATDGIGVADVALKLGISRRLLSLRYAQLKGESVHDAIVKRRLDCVCRMLKETDRPICDITSRCGFENENYLKNLFKKRFGVSMRHWRASL